MLLWVVITISSVLSSFSWSSISLYPWNRPQGKILLSIFILILYIWYWCTWLEGHLQLSIVRITMKIQPMFRMIFPRGAVNIVYKVGPEGEPWGTPKFSVTCADVQDPIWKVCVRSLRYDSSHLKATQLIPKDWFNKFNNFWWSLVWNAALKSSSTKIPLITFHCLLGASKWTKENADFAV